MERRKYFLLMALLAGMVFATCKNENENNPIYSVAIGALANANGSVIAATPAAGGVGTEIVLTVTPAEGYRLKAGTLKYNGTHAIDETTLRFNLPSENVIITAEFENVPIVEYSVAIGALANANGSVIAATPAAGSVGTEIVLTVTPAEGYRLKAGTLKYNGTHAIDETTLRFNLPSENVIITAEFENAPYIQGMPHLINIDNAPAIGKGREVGGHIEFYDGSVAYTDYRITMALEVTRGGKVWAPKPYAVVPFAAIDGDGTFSCLFVSGGSDNDAERLYVYLIPNSFTPNSDYLRTEQVAIDKVVIERYADGTVEVIYQRKIITSGRVNTMHKAYFTHGRLDASIKTPKTANGMWPAFWLMGENFEEGWPECGEIDIMELGSAEGIREGTQERFLTRGTHWGSTSSDGAHPAYSRNDAVIPDLSEDFHLYTMIWDESYIRMYLDLDKNPSAAPYYEIRIDAGALDQAQYHVKDYFHKPFFIILNVAVGGDFPKIYDIDAITALNEENRYEASMYVDYIQCTSGDSTWEDHFDGTALNAEFWNIEINSDGGGNHELQHYRAGNVSIGEEPESNKRCLVLTAKKEW